MVLAIAKLTLMVRLGNRTYQLDLIVVGTRRVLSTKDKMFALLDYDRKNT